LHDYDKIYSLEARVMFHQKSSNRVPIIHCQIELRAQLSQMYGIAKGASIKYVCCKITIVYPPVRFPYFRQTPSAHIRFQPPSPPPGGDYCTCDEKEGWWRAELIATVSHSSTNMDVSLKDVSSFRFYSLGERNVILKYCIRTV